MQHKAVTVDDFSTEALSSVFCKVTSLRETDNRLQLYFPKVQHEQDYVTPEKWLVAALNFDGLFASYYPSFKQNTTLAFQQAKETALSQLSCVDQSIMSSSVKKYYNKCCKQIEYYEGMLEDKFNHVCKEYRDVLSSIIEQNSTRYGVAFSDYGGYYADYRNKIAHGTVEPITNTELAVFIVMRAIIYILLLKDTAISKDELTSIINKLFS